MEIPTKNDTHQDPLLERLPEAPEGSPVPSSSREGSPPSSLHRWFSFKSGFERLDLHVVSDFPSESVPCSPSEIQKSIASPMEQQRFKAWSSPPPEPPKWETFLCAFLYGWWAVELLAFVVSLASLVAMIVLLRHYDGRSPPDWPHNITLNSVLSWCTTVFKASLLVPMAACFGQASWVHYRSGSRPLTDLAIYDSASRGPMGAMQLLWYFKAKYVASIGAIATILALGVDPIMQQTLSIKVDVVNVTDVATLGRAQSFVQWNETSSQPPQGPANIQPPADMVAAMYDGMFSGALSDPNLSCSTGNCTFPPFKTLAVCSECQNITDALSKQCHSQIDPLFTFCEHSLPNGLKMNKTFEMRTLATGGRLESVGPPPYPQSILNFTGIWSGPPVEDPGVGVERPKREAALSTKDVSATQCFLYWCVNTMQAAVMNGQTSETKMDSWYNETALPFEDVAFNFDVLTSENATWNLKPPLLNANDSSFDFVVARYASEALNLWLVDHLTISTSPHFLDDDGVENACGHYRYCNAGCFDPDKERILESNVTAMFEKLAATMTRKLRSTSIDSQSLSPASLHVLGVGPVKGTATSREIRVLVRWPWLAFPVALLLMALVFFFLTLLSTSRHQLEIWKLSPFPLIFNRIIDSQLAPQSEMLPAVQPMTIPDMERKAARISARLEEWDIGPRLTSSNGHLRDMPLKEDPSS
ncbi:hypothetical protein MMC07_004928 [Pseudocyphellaria aurata]|nr:hypothetical protein [Pseudocyphellaria aurata]